jgi:hypothetical protein
MLDEVYFSETLSCSRERLGFLVVFVPREFHDQISDEIIQFFQFV